MALGMSKAAREAFLADLHVGVISIEVEGEAPLSVPIWYDYAPDVGVWVITEATSQKGVALKRAERFSLCAQNETPPAYQPVSVTGPIVETRPADKERDSRPMAHRYFGRESGDLYTDSEGGGDNLVFAMRPERWRTVDYGNLIGSTSAA